MVKEGACIIDVGINRIFNENTGKYELVGDVDYEGNFLLNILIGSFIKSFCAELFDVWGVASKEMD